ncbi:hypothetical protein Rhom172_1887 [Rhodothermus marinus SG0.5JP17-172]|jgi:hypothetical protein|uniref:DUF4249 family protein n=1 Tax=Rhodothermus marinus TaxID=29549 RepID=UPI000223D69A|nr:DUF4249 family protein [Rhodothermus marinus]AEN73801.1 hypothetical protein Rhom172_1887 [Rhodothermus marinus SG0.5JP17-172]MBO2491586.1 DUF4249 domain-containing protein [Rhodothermus marinus]
MPRALWLVLIGVLGWAACDQVEPVRFAPEYVVESYQIAGEPLQPVWLTRTLPIEAIYVPDSVRVRGAQVRIALLDEQGVPERWYPYEEHPDSPGYYVPAPLVREVRVRPLRTYRLEARMPDGALLTAETTVPDTFRVLGANLDAVRYQSEVRLELIMTRSEYPGRQAVYIITTEALEPTEENLTPFGRALYEDSTFTLEELRVSGSPILNEANYTELPDGTLRLQLPWLAVLFYGPNRVTISALDDNLYDLIRTQSVQQGGSTLSPGEIPAVLEHVEGGRGVFGSYARVQYTFVVAR